MGVDVNEDVNYRSLINYFKRCLTKTVHTDDLIRFANIPFCVLSGMLLEFVTL